jgi:chloramphenicol-sensitive protein RarD
MDAPLLSAADQRHRAGLFLGLGAYLVWGVMPIYFKLLSHVGAGEILAHRIVWSLVLLGSLATVWRRWPAIRTALVDRKVLLTLLATSALISVNWLVYIIAVVSGHVLEASLGYYLNPLVSILMGVAILGERLTRTQVGATLLAAAGVAVLAAGAGSGLWISLVLASTFATYGFLRKVVRVDPLEGLTIETVILTPLAMGGLVWLTAAGGAGIGHWSLATSALLILGGAITAMPLLMFTAAAKRLPLSVLGFLQYIAPSLQFLCAVVLFGEKLTSAHIVCFAAIWTALVIFTADSWRRSVVARRERTAEGLA